MTISLRVNIQPEVDSLSPTTRNLGLGGFFLAAFLQNASINGILRRFKLALLNSDFVLTFCIKH